MSVITESQLGDKIVIIENFVTCKDKNAFKWENSKEFCIGDVVEFVDYYKDQNIKQEHLIWQIKFKAEDGIIYNASQLYFVTKDVWEDIKMHCKQSDLK